MLSYLRRSTMGLAAVALCCSGCGGGGGGGGVPEPPTPPVSLGLTAAAPEVASKLGQTVQIPVTVTGPGTITTASLDVTVSEATFEPVATRAVPGTAQAIDGLPASTAASYKWIDAHTIRVLYASADGAASGAVLLSIPVKVKSETPSTPTIGNVSINR